VNCAAIFYITCSIQAIAMNKLKRIMANIAPFITCFMVVCFFTVKKSMQQAESNGLIHQLKNEADEMYLNALITNLRADRLPGHRFIWL
jgi:c-di-AMP phosphodiesterase-like protein